MRDGCFVIEGGALICLSVMGRLGLDLSGAHLKFASVMSWKNCSRWCCRDLGGVVRVRFDVYRRRCRWGFLC